MKKINLLKFFLIILVLFIVSYGTNFEKTSVELLSIPSLVGFDIDNSGKDAQYRISVCAYIFKEDETTEKKVSTGIALSPGQARQNRQLKLGRSFLIGLEKADIIGEDNARKGIKNTFDILFNNPSVNDTAFVAVCGGSALDILKFNIQGYATAGDFLEEMIKNSKAYSFFTDNYKIIDAFVRVDSEGRSLTLPYIEITKEGLNLTGLALFNGDKMVRKLSLEDSKVLNMLSENAGKGMINLQKNSDEYVDFYTKVKRKVNCTKKDGKYKFDIMLNFKGDIITNQYNKKIQTEYDEKEKLEKIFANKIEAECKKFIAKMQNDYNVDCLELGRIAAAKYGRDLGVDWDREISEAIISVKATVKIVKQGRGDY